MRFVAVFLSLLAFVAAPAAAAASPDLVSVEQQLGSLLAGNSADVGVAALDLNTGESISIKGDTPFPMASTVKVAIAALYLSQVDHHQKTLDDTIHGESVRGLMGKMLIYSDNRAADVLFKDVGDRTRCATGWFRMASRACMSTGRSLSFWQTSATFGTPGIPAPPKQWSTS